MVKHNFARGAVDIFDAGMWELYCTSPRLTISLAFSQHTQNSLKELYVWTAKMEVLALYSVLWLQLLHHLRLCVWLVRGSGWFGAGGLLNLSISGGKAATLARPAHPRPLPSFVQIYFWCRGPPHVAQVFLMRCAQHPRQSAWGQSYW